MGDKLVEFLKGRDDQDKAAMAAAGGGGYSSVAAQSGDAAAAQAFASAHLAQFGWGQDQMPPLITLWNKESGWNANAVNASSGAYGIPQALGHGHPYNLGDYANQVLWGLDYIKGRYGSPAAALQFHLGHNWYSQGGVVPGKFDEGGWLMPGMTAAQNATGGREMVLPPNMSETIMRMHDMVSRVSGDDDDHRGHYPWGWEHHNRWPGHDWGHEVHDPGSHIWPWHRPHTQLGKFLASGHDGSLGFSQLMQGDKSMLNALGLSGSGSPFAGLFLNSNFGHTGMGNAYEHNALTWGTRSGGGQGNRHTDGSFQGHGSGAMNAFVGGLFGTGGQGGWGGGPGGYGGGEGRHMYVDMRGCQIMSDYDMDILINKFSRRVAQWGFPSAGVQIRR